MQWQQFWDKQAASKERQQQVGRTTREGEQPDLGVIAEHICQLLDLQSDDTLLDVCCGNGDLTVLLASRVSKAWGIDISAGQITRARERYPQHHWQQSPADQLPAGLLFDKINLYFSFQYFTTDTAASAVLSALKSSLKPGGKILLGDIPDARFWWSYYKSPRARLRWLWHKIKGTEDMGRFWHRRQLDRLASKAGLTTYCLDEPAHLPFAWYRFDAVLIHTPNAV